MSTITVTTEGLDTVIARFSALPRQIDAATKRAIRKTTGWVASQAKKDIAGELGVAQKAIANRLATASNPAGGVVWFGLNPVAVTLKRFHGLRQDQAGVKAGSLRFPGAFVAKMPNGAVGAFRRVGASRFPIRIEAIPMQTPAISQIIAAHADRARERVATVLAQELNYEINVKGAD